MQLNFRAICARAAVMAFLILSGPATATAQDTFSNLGRGAPLWIEDARPLDRFVGSVYLSPATVRTANGTTSWSSVPGLALGIAARTQVDFSLPVASYETAGTRRTGLTGAEASLLYALNVESRSWPAIAVRAGVLMPLGDVGVQESHEWVRAIASRTFPWARAHFNHEYVFGSESDAGAAALDLSRWTSGFGLDRPFARQHLLIGGEVLAREPIGGSADPQWAARGGVRYQLTRAVIIDLGVGHRFSDGGEWMLSLGAALSASRPTLIPGLGPWGGSPR